MLKIESIRSYVTLAGVGLLLAEPVGAATDTTNMTIEASVTANCTISSGGLNFGPYDPIDANAATPLDQQGTVTVACTDGSGFAITLGQGANADTGSTDAVPLRRMANGGGEFLEYGLFSDTERETLWGNDTDTDVATTGTGIPQNFTVFGRVTQGQNVPAGTYTDTVLATVTF
jgi:spore coat protein U-like protein